VFVLIFDIPAPETGLKTLLAARRGHSWLRGFALQLFQFGIDG
jgi:hypothetical protein